MMLDAPLITLTTDFGTRDGFVAQMKGVILGINPRARLIDGTHDIEPFSVLEGALVLKGISPHFPRGTIHVAVVDPGVGSKRRGVVLCTKEQTYVGPDNGLFSLIMSDNGSCVMREIQNRDYMLPEPHPTFHGRDIFAPVAAHLSAGKAFEEVGPLVHDPIMLSIPTATMSAAGLEGAVIYVDRFGNLTSNIDKTMLSKIVGTVGVGDVTIQGLGCFFGEVPEGEPMALINSFGLLEIAVNQGNAAQVLGIGKDEPVRVFWT
jgi:S-adenosyl-L-methionine hydrolase (adenosine-forming)